MVAAFLGGETAVGQNLIDDFSSDLGLSMRGTLGGGRVLGWFLERGKPCERNFFSCVGTKAPPAAKMPWGERNLTLGWKHLAVVILQ